ncbi:MAG: hypothetical protein SVV03_04895 [Candidatus Nanohaloarchaea archaeon]|nr:hypothetical protein [Candidatus Nanohaloarchaea archaeon]
MVERHSKSWDINILDKVLKAIYPDWDLHDQRAQVYLKSLHRDLGGFMRSLEVELERLDSKDSGEEGTEEDKIFLESFDELMSLRYEDEGEYAISDMEAVYSDGESRVEFNFLNLCYNRDVPEEDHPFKLEADRGSDLYERAKRSLDFRYRIRF